MNDRHDASEEFSLERQRRTGRASAREKGEDESTTTRPNKPSSTEVKCLPLAMLCHADHVPDHLGGSYAGDQAIVSGLEREVLFPLIGIEPRFAVRSILFGFTGHHVIFPTDAVRKRIILHLRG